MILITVIVCTYNRSSLLKKCIESLIDQSASFDQYEILVLDNNSSDNTKNVCLEYTNKYENIRYILETEQGISIARNTGWKKAKGKYTAFIDDDAKPDRKYIEKAIEIIGRLPDETIGIGGPIYPFYLTKKPKWFKDDYEKRELLKSSGYLSNKNRLFSGSNIILKKTELERSGGFNNAFGMKGNKLNLGEETLLLHELIRLNNNRDDLFYYSTDLIVYHLTQEFKMNPKYILKRKLFSTIKKFKRMDNNIFLKIVLVFKNLILLIINTIILIISLPFYRYINRWIVERMVPVVKSFGFFIALFGININFRNK